MAATARVVDTIASVDPATGRVNSELVRTATLDVPGRMARVRKAQEVWAGVRVAERCRRIGVLKRKLLEAQDALADVVVRESGKPKAEALFADVFVSVDTAAYFEKHGAELLKTEKVKHHSTAAKLKKGWLHYEPLGVAGIISSWNYPLAIPMSQIIAALAAGNGVLCKTSDFTPECGAAIEAIVREAGFPEDLVAVLQGGGDVGQALIESRPDKVFFTGSVFTGKHVAEACARLLIPSVLELGGKDAMVVLGDANLEVASSAAVWGSYTNCGQVCLSVERLFVEEGVAGEFVAKCVEKTKQLRLGPGADAGTDVGPLIRPQHVQRMSDLLADAVKRGAKVECGGKARPDLGPNFFEPTVVTGADGSMMLFQDETFGPILAVRTVKDEDEAVRRANESEFGLAASVWTKDEARGKRIAGRLRAGTVMVNDLLSGFAIAEAPHGGAGLSGWGRTHGRAGFQEMVRVKYVDVDGMPGTEKPWWFRYGGELEKSAGAFLRFEFGGWGEKWRNAKAAVGTLMRKHW